MGGSFRKPAAFKMMNGAFFCLITFFSEPCSISSKFRGSRNLVGITIQLSNSEEKELFIRYSMQISSE